MTKHSPITNSISHTPGFASNALCANCNAFLTLVGLDDNSPHFWVSKFMAFNGLDDLVNAVPAMSADCITNQFTW